MKHAAYRFRRFHMDGHNSDIFFLSTRGTTSYQIVLCWIFLEVLTRFFNAFMGHFRTFGQHLYNTMQHGK